ncbi:MAG TPA: ABC transporter permease subunit/CPBP intramembrane protease [Longimicrobium sp.]|nr:ABC transporter permease subunit/CPBP intramembrane protease [Longimicrobium sp.]
MNLRLVLTVLAKELRETLRDRRTLFMMIVIPTLLYPGLMVLMEQLSLIGQRRLTERPAAVAVQGVDPALTAFLRRDTAIRVLPAESASVNAIRQRHAEAAIVLARSAGAVAGTDSVRVLYDPSYERSQRAHDVAGRALRTWNDTLLARRLSAQGLPPAFARPLAVTDSSVATAAETGAYALGRFLPVLLILMTLLGAFYPAIDLAAGEKERGTLETLLTAPVPAGEIVAGKFAAVALIGMAAAAANLLSMLLTFQSGVFKFAKAANVQFTLPWTTALLVLVGLIPLAVLFSALFLGIAVRSQSFKEAQNALTPVQLASTLPIFVITLPGIEFNAALAAVPVVGIAMMFRELMTGSAGLVPSLVAFGSTVLYAGLALFFAARAFGREDVLFGGGAATAPRGGWRERLAAWRAGGRRVPLPVEALAFVALIALLFFHAGTALQARFGERGLLLSQWGLLFLPALAMVLVGPFDARRTLALRRPTARGLAGAVLLALGGIPVGWAIGWLQLQWWDVPRDLFGGLARLVTATDLPRFLWLMLLVAVTPAVCEEVVFRGVLFQSLAREQRMWRTVAMTALIFGAFHLSSETAIRFLPTAWLGVLMGIAVWRTRSIFASMLMHFVNNGLAVVIVSRPELRRMVLTAAGEPNWWLVALAPLALAAGLWLLPRRTRRADDEVVAGADQ